LITEETLASTWKIARTEENHRIVPPSRMELA